MAASVVNSESAPFGNSDTAANSKSVTSTAERAPMAVSFLISPTRFWPQYWLPSTIMPLLMP